MLRAMLLLVALLIAGCAEGTTQEPLKGLVATEHTGILAGVIVDQTINPVEGALIALPDIGRNTTSDQDGRFGMDGLEGGTYRVFVTHPGHLPVETHAIVTAGLDNPPLLTLQIRAVAPNWWIEAHQVAGALELGMASAVAGTGGPSLACCSDYFWQTELTRGTPDWAQSEVLWESTLPTADRMRLTHSGGETCVNGTVFGACALDVYDDHEGESPIILATPGDQIVMEAEPVLIVSLFPGAGGVPDVAELGLAIEQPFEMFVHVFYGFVPDDDWAFIFDGSHKVPT